MGLTDLLQTVPWDMYYSVKNAIKKNFGTKSYPTGVPALIVTDDTSPQDLYEELRSRHFELGVYEYNYEGQIWGIRRPEYLDEEAKEATDCDYELHSRCFTDTRGVVVVPHAEPNRYSESGAHVSDKYLNKELGCRLMAQELSDAGISYKRDVA